MRTAEQEEVFTRRALLALALCGGVAVFVTLAYMVFGKPAPDVRTAEANSFSRSALGFRALVEWLREEVPVVVSRNPFMSAAAPGSPLLILAPPANDTLRSLWDRNRDKGPVVVVLPKWQGRTDDGAWVSRVEWRDVSQPRAVLRILSGGHGDLRRPDEPLQVAGATLPYPQLIAPGSGLEVVLGDDGGVLVGRLPESRTYVVSDPDLLNTAGLGRGANARVARDFLVGRLEAHAVVIDETLHGFAGERSIWRVLLEFPLVCLTLHLAVLLCLALWATTGRFGPPLPPPSRLPPGKLALLESTARLLTLGTRGSASLEPYLHLTLRAAARRSPPPPGLSRAGELEYFNRLAVQRGAREDVVGLAREATLMPDDALEPRRVLQLARALYRWRTHFLR